MDGCFALACLFLTNRGLLYSRFPDSNFSLSLSLIVVDKLQQQESGSNWASTERVYFRTKTDTLSID